MDPAQKIVDQVHILPFLVFFSRSRRAHCDVVIQTLPTDLVNVRRRAGRRPDVPPGPAQIFGG